MFKTCPHPDMRGWVGRRLPPGQSLVEQEHHLVEHLDRRLGQQGQQDRVTPFRLPTRKGLPGQGLSVRLLPGSTNRRSSRWSALSRIVVEWRDGSLEIYSKITLADAQDTYDQIIDQFPV